MSLRKMIPELLGQQIANPGMFEEQFLKFLQAAKFDVSGVAKTIGKMELYHYRTMAALNEQKFFTGTFEAGQTNVPSSNYVRPKGEHMVIYGIKIEEAVGATAVNLDWTAGASSAYAKNANISVKLNGLDRLKSVPLSSAPEDLTTGDKGIIMLDEPIIWGGEIENITTITAPQLTEVGAANSWIRVTFVGIGLFA
jgi:hypothetical protein